MLPHRQDTKEAHGEALGEDEVRLTKIAYGWPPDAHFLVPDEVKAYMGKAVERGAQWEQEWNDRYNAWAKEFPDLAKTCQQMLNQELPDGWDKDIPTFPADAKGIATRESDSKVLNAVAKNVPWLLGGAADLYPSTKTLIDGAGNFEKGSYSGRNFHFGIREHTMGSIVNGMSLSGLRAVRSDLLHLLGLHAAGTATGGDDGPAGDLHLHPRFVLPGRGRADAPADRASHVRARHSAAAALPARGRQRGCRGVALHHAA